jgi:hypothetical protein
MINLDSNFQRNQVHTLAIFNQQFGREGHLENIIKANSRMMKCCAISMANLNDMLKGLMRKYGDDE